MKTSREIHEKIDELLDKISKMSDTDEEQEFICNQIDALLWIIGDESGKPI